ncbi:DUF742 domain-containing protein [Streptomyces sp. NPDC094021]|uniref:DUF742 domain-containing protein n=1 Tax=Streptomyces sp. NPDC094021 TaxID=3366054 RepID=UPI0038248875
MTPPRRQRRRPNPPTPPPSPSSPRLRPPPYADTADGRTPHGPADGRVPHGVAAGRSPHGAPEGPQAHGTPDGQPPPRNPERLYAVTGTADGGRAELDLVTLIVARRTPPPGASPEHTAVLDLCAAPLSLAELSAYLTLPFSAMTVLITEMITAELVQARAPATRRTAPDRSLLEAVMHGLQKL